MTPFDLVRERVPHTPSLRVGILRSRSRRCGGTRTQAKACATARADNTGFAFSIFHSLFSIFAFLFSRHWPLAGESRPMTLLDFFAPVAQAFLPVQPSHQLDFHLNSLTCHLLQILRAIQ